MKMEPISRCMEKTAADTQHTASFRCSCKIGISDWPKRAADDIEYEQALSPDEPKNGFCFTVIMIRKPEFVP